MNEKEKSVFVALVELKPLAGCGLDPNEIAGAAVRCYVSESCRRAAIEKLESSFDENRFKLIELEWCVDESEVEWENPDDETARKLVDSARTTNEVVYGEFHVWEGGSTE